MYEYETHGKKVQDRKFGKQFLSCLKQKILTCNFITYYKLIFRKNLKFKFFLKLIIYYINAFKQKKINYLYKYN